MFLERVFLNLIFYIFIIIIIILFFYLFIYFFGGGGGGGGVVNFWCSCWECLYVSLSDDDLYPRVYLICRTKLILFWSLVIYEQLILSSFIGL